MTGRFGVVRTVGEKVTADLIGGTNLKYNGVELNGLAEWTGQIIKVVRKNGEGTGGWFIVGETVPTTCAGKVLSICHPDGSTHAYNIVKVQPIATGTKILIREDPAFSIGTQNTQWLRCPKYTISGTKNIYTIINL